MSAPKSVLLLRPGALGDAVLTLPVLRKLRAAGAQQIYVLSSRSSWAFLPPKIPGLSILDLNSPAWLALFAPGLEFPPEIQSLLEQIDLAVVYLKPDRSAVENALRNAGVKQVLGATPPLQDDTGTLHASDSLVQGLGEKIGAANSTDGEWPLSKPSTTEIQTALSRLQLPAETTPRLFVFHPGSGGRKKCWPAERFARAARFAQQECGMTPVLLGGEADTEAWQRFDGEWARLNSGATAVAPLYRAWQWPLREVAALLAASHLYLGNDSGITHLAGQLAPRVLALFGPTDSRVWKPLGASVRVLRANESALAPMEQLSEEKVFEAIRHA